MPGPGEDDVAVRRPHLDRLDDLDQVDAVPLGEQAPLVQERQDRRPVGVLDDLGGLRLDRAIHHRQRELLGVEHLAEELLDPRRGPRRCSRSRPARNRGSRQTYSRPGITRSKLWASSGSLSMPRAAKAFFMIGQATNSVVPGATVVSISVRQCGWTFCADGPHGRLQGAHLGLAGAHVAEIVLRVVALHVDHHAVGQLEAVAVERGHQRLLLLHAAGDHRIDLGVLGLDRRLAAVEHRDLPVAARAGPLAADDELARLAGLLVDGVGDDGGHDRADEADAHDHDDLLAFAAGLLGQRLDPRKFPGIIGLGGNGELFAGGIDRNMRS